MIYVCVVIAVCVSLLCLYLVRALQRSARHLATLSARCRELERTREQLVNHAYFDHLTGLANRSLLEDRFKLAIERTKRSQVPFAVIMIDLNDFKGINDAMGHIAGDALLVEVSRRLVNAVRASDTVARFGGDEFVLIVESLAPGIEFGPIALKLFEALSVPLTFPDGRQIQVGASLGFAVYPRDGEAMTDLLNVADRAMYDCKASGMMPLFQDSALLAA
jgi:diguanylate cyclase (GGDEF)-like protein